REPGRDPCPVRPGAKLSGGPHSKLDRMELLWQRGDPHDRGSRAGRRFEDPLRIEARGRLDDLRHRRAWRTVAGALAAGALGGESRTMRFERAIRLGAAAMSGLLLLGAQSVSPKEQVDRMLARLLRAPEFRSRVVITRSDPFGGPPEHSAGRVWFLPGRGLRFHSEERGGEDIVLDREKGVFLVYRPSEQTV